MISKIQGDIKMTNGITTIETTGNLMNEEAEIKEKTSDSIHLQKRTRSPSLAWFKPFNLLILSILPIQVTF